MNHFSALTLTFAVALVLSSCVGVLAVPVEADLEAQATQTSDSTWDTSLPKDPVLPTLEAGFVPPVMELIYVSSATNRTSPTDLTSLPGAYPANSTDSTGEWHGDEDSVIGLDNRVLWPNRDFPYSTMGKLVISDGSYCSAALVGPRHIATAGHCIKGFTLGTWWKFSPNFYRGDVRPIAYTFKAYVYPLDLSEYNMCSYMQDWGVMVLDRYLGDTNGYLSVLTLEGPDILDVAEFFHYGYPSDLPTIRTGGQLPYRQKSISIHSNDYCNKYGPLATNADVATGQSGGPLVWEHATDDGMRYTVGVAAVGQVSETWFAGGKDWFDAVVQARMDYS